jgi:hypothetical protein
MPKRKDGGRPPGETRDSKAERVHAAAMAIVESDAQSMRAKTERLRELRLQKEAMDGMSATIPEEYKRLYLEFEAALANAAKVLRAKGIDSEEFRQADAAAGAQWLRLRELQDIVGKHWMG